MSTERTAIVASADTPCAACPWRTVNHGRKHPDGWYTKANRRFLWNGLRTGEAPGMTCHPTDPDNQPLAHPVDTRECAGAVLLLAREWAALQATLTGGGSFADYRRARPRGLTKRGAAAMLSRLVYGGSALDPRPELLGREIVEHDDVEHGT